MITETEARSSENLAKDSCGKAVTLCQDFCLHLVGNGRVGHCHISQCGLWCLYSSGVCSGGLKAKRSKIKYQSAL